MTLIPTIRTPVYGSRYEQGTEVEKICGDCDFWGASSGEFGICVGPDSADRAARTDTCKDFKLRESLAEDGEPVGVNEQVATP